MNNTFRLNPLATSMSFILGSSLILSATAQANTCTNYSPEGTCALTEYQMTSPLSPSPVAWYFTTPTQDAAINSRAKAQNIYFASGTSSRTEKDIQQLFVDGAHLSGYYINASRNGSAVITLANKAVVDWIEAGGAITNTRILVDNSTLNGANAAVDYDKTNKTPYSKNYARGYALYLASNDNGNTDIDIVHGSQVTGRILAGGKGTHDITLEDSAIKAGGILLYNTGNTNNINMINSDIDTTNAVVSTSNAIEITHLAQLDTTNTITIDNSHLTGSVSVASSGSTNVLSIKNTALGKTNQADGNAIMMKNGAVTQLTLDNAQIDGHAVLSGTETLSASLDTTRMDGNIIANNAAQIAMDITRSVLNGNIETTNGQGTVDLDLRDSLVLGDIDLRNNAVTRSDVWLTNAQIQGHLYGSGDNSTLHVLGTTSLNGEQFSDFSQLKIGKDTTLKGGFTRENVGAQLTVNGETLTAPVQLSSGKLVFDRTKLIADTLSLKNGAALLMTHHSQLQTRSDQLFNASTAAEQPAGYNETGKHLSLMDSTLILTDSMYQLDYVKSVNSLIGLNNGNTLVMLGSIENAEKAAGTASVTDASITQAVLANTRVTSSKNQLIIGAEDGGTADSLSVGHGFGAAQLSLEGTGTPSVEIRNGQSLTLTGAGGGPLIDVAGKTGAAINVAINNGTLNLGSTVAGSESNALTGTVTLASQGTLNIVAGDHTIASGNTAAGVVSSGQVTINQHAVLRSDVELHDNARLAVNGSLMAGQMHASQAARITVGDATAAGTLIAQQLDLQGASVFIDPAWVQDGTLADASKMVSGDQAINGRLTAGQNALLVLGDTTSAAAETRFSDTGLRWGSDDITAALAVQAPQYLSATQGGLRVDGSLTASKGADDAALNTVKFADHSLLMVNGQDINHGQAALNAENGTLNVASTAALYVADAKANQRYVVAKGFNDVNIAGNGWQGDNLLLNKLLIATTQEQNGEVTVTTRARAAQDVLPGIVTVHALDTLIASGENDRTAARAGKRFLSIAIDTPEVGVKQVVAAVNSAAQMAIAGGVQSNTWAAGMAAVNAVLDRNSFTNNPQHKARPDASVWVQTLYGNMHSSDLSAGTMRYGQNSDFYGLMLGADKEYETTLGKMRTGAAFHAGNGDSDSRGDFNATHNDFSFWGVSLYQNWTHQQVSVTGDVSLTQSSNDLDQNPPSGAGMGEQLNANVDAQLFSVGLQGEYRIETTIVDIIPHAGVRYNQLKTEAFDTQNTGDETVFHTDKGTQNIWQFPVGVKLDKTFALDSGWNLNTQADAGVVAVTGDRDVNQRLHTSGIRSSDVISAEILDDTAFRGQVGVTFQKGNQTFGVGYNVNASKNETGQTVSASYRLGF